MKCVTCLLSMFLVFAESYGQDTPNPDLRFFLSAGNSYSGSGDINGLYLKLGFQKKVKRWNFSVSQNTTIHDGTYPIFYETSPGNMMDGSIKFTVTGIELLPMVGYSFINSGRHDLQLALGPVLRYQSRGDNDSYALLYPAATGLPVPVLYFTNSEPLRTFAIGPVLQASYDVRLGKRWLAGISGSFQFDTYGDVLSNYGFRLGYRLCQ